MLIEGVTLRQSPMWVIHPVLSTNVTVRNVSVLSLGPNSDGCNPESSSDVLIEDSVFDTGDDCIALKSGRNADGRRLKTPVERVVVRGCRDAGRARRRDHRQRSERRRARRLRRRCVMSSPQLDRGLRIKTNAMRGGVIENVFVRDVEIGEVGSAIDIDMRYEEGDAGPFVPVVRNVLVERMTVGRAERAVFVRTLDRSPVTGLTVRDSVFRGLRRGNRLEGVLGLVFERVTFEPAASN